MGTAKNAIVVWIGIVFLGETVTVLQGVGYAISLGGFAAYNYLKMQPDAAGACNCKKGRAVDFYGSGAISHSDLSLHSTAKR